MKKVLVLAAFLASGMAVSAQASHPQKKEESPSGKRINTAQDDAAGQQRAQEAEKRMEETGQPGNPEKSYEMRRMTNTLQKPGSQSNMDTERTGPDATPQTKPDTPEAGEIRTIEKRTRVTTPVRTDLEELKR